jgi:multiple sugar transport system ATP-binding protein
MLTENVKGLPGGVQQRIGVARALVRNPKVLILDEPISHLEEELKAKMREELKRLQRKLGVTTLYVTHDQIEAMVMADRIAVMNFGVLQQVDTPENIFHHPANTFVGGFIGEPPMNFITCTFNQNPLALRFDDVTVPFNHTTAHKLAGLGKKELILGIRDSHILVSTTQKEACVKGSVFFIEPRNEEMLLTVALGKQHLLVTIDTDSSIRIGDTLWVTFDYGKCSYFDVETKNNLL